MDWEKELFWLTVATAVTALIALVGTIVNYRLQKRKSLSDNAWADYELRRDLYLDLVAGIDCLFNSGSATDRPDWHKTARKVRMIGSDQVVAALNDFTAAIKVNAGNAEQRYSDLNLALRRDIRHLRKTPSEGTNLDTSDFPIEG
ncbi:hypothetical protein C6558_03385 [Ensifer sp. NM-2]|uniref:hypothetical protein n=1 Tax=Ensifer sp. NM-2 TaxID=2109730 RepID=UPI000D1315C1|nr:hypothetical protein [Ensifer sp. NM-2]PSS67069.1 hypothetical protein C6558_03385 [Ensifer sp. NM-2]